MTETITKPRTSVNLNLAVTVNDGHSDSDTPVLDLWSTFDIDDIPYRLAGHAIDAIVSDANSWTFSSGAEPCNRAGSISVTLTVTFPDEVENMPATESFTVNATTNGSMVPAIRKSLYAVKDSMESWIAKRKRIAAGQPA